MKALILAAGVGVRLGPYGQEIPKCLLPFGARSLIARQLERLRACGIERVHIGIGYKAELIEAELEKHGDGMDVSTTFNPDYTRGNILTVLAMREHFVADQPVLLMDADVLCDTRMLRRLIESAHADCVLLDRDFEPGAEPVKVCVSNRNIVEFGKELPAGLVFDVQGESVGFFKLAPGTAEDLVARCKTYVQRGCLDEHYEAPLRDAMLSEDGPHFGVEDVTGLPWIEIDFPQDISRAEAQVLPRLKGP
ncbi:MAG: NTP transferase domain-containing protein [Gammaproteobacteria bacterium]|nr:NTP transferase domain-containing protein [Gammaproteobacteria bacterium]